MQIVASTFLALIVVVVLAIRGPRRGLTLALAMAPLGAAAAFNLPAAGGASILVLDLVAITLFALVFLSPDGIRQIAGSMRAGQPGFWLLLLIAFCFVASLFFPRLFAGYTEVFSLSRVNNETGIISVPLRPTTGNLTQLFRILLGVLAFFALATAFRRKPDAGLVVKAMIVATVVHFLLGWLDVASFAVGLRELLDPIRTANYAILADNRMVGLKRMIGGFPEASAFGYFTLGLFGFWLQYWVSGGRSRWAGWMLLASAIVLLRCTSSAAYVAAVAFGGAFALISYARGLRRQVRRRTAAIWVFAGIMVWMLALGLFASYNLVEPVTAYLDRALFDKLEGASGVERMSWNAQAFQNFLDTWLMGAGLGSVRASNWLLACLGSIGLVGTLLFFAFLWQVANLREAAANDERSITIKALKSGCMALFCSAMLTLATPDLGIFFFALAGLAAGLARGSVLEASQQPVSYM